MLAEIAQGQTNDKSDLWRAGGGGLTEGQKFVEGHGIVESQYV